MYCKNCGSENDDVARFCRDCGRAITGSSPSMEKVASADSGDTPDVVEAPTKANTWVWVAVWSGARRGTGHRRSNIPRPRVGI